MSIKSKIQNAKRRGLKYVAINEPFKNCEGHHISLSHVIFVPSELHRNTPHSAKNNKNMDKINRAAFKYMLRHKEHITIPIKDVRHIAMKTMGSTVGLF